jgi:hypothetical protein
MKTLQPNYAFSPSLLDAFQRMVDTKAEDYFYQDETGAWHLNWNETEETLHFSEEEVDALLKQEFLDKVNKVPMPPSEAASKGTAFNEILDCLIMKRKPQEGIIIKTIRKGEDLYEARLKKLSYEADILGKNVIPEELKPEPSMEEFKKIGVTFIYVGIDGFEFFFDKDFCLEAADYFKGSICQYYTKANLETSKGVVELHGYIDYLRMMKVFDAKTTKRYTFGDFQKKWQRYTYPYTLIESEMMNEVQSFEYTIYLLKGGSGRTPLITGTQYKEVYTYDHEQARTMLVQQCERLIEFLENNRDKITNEKIFGNGISDNR